VLERRKTRNLPDDTAIFLEFEDCYEFREIGALGMKYFPASLDAPPALILPGGQEFDEEHYIGARFDVYLDCGPFPGGLEP